MTKQEAPAPQHPLDALLNGGVKLEWNDQYHGMDGNLRLCYRANGDPMIARSWNAVMTGLPNDLYHAERDHLSSTSLKLFAKNPKKYKRIYVDKGSDEDAAEPEGDKYKKFGTLVHSIVLEPETLDDLYAVFDNGPDGEPWNARRKLHSQWKEIKERETGKRFLHSSEFNTAMACAEEAMSNARAAELINGTELRHRELSVFCADGESGVRIKARFDLLLMYEGRPTIVDVKTTAADASPEGFSSTLGNLGYDVSAALYCMAFHTITGVWPRFLWIVIEKDKDGDNQCVVHELREGDMMLALDETRSYLTDISLAGFSQFKSPYHNKINIVSIPSWRFRKQRQ